MRSEIDMRQEVESNQEKRGVNNRSEMVSVEKKGNENTT